MLEVNFMTFSIVARDVQAGELGIAVQSKFLAVGAVVPWARAGVGAIATQSWANTTYGPRGLDLLASGLSASKTMEQLTRDDDRRAMRQVGIVGIEGAPATFTRYDSPGRRCGNAVSVPVVTISPVANGGAQGWAASTFAKKSSARSGLPSALLPSPSARNPSPPWSVTPSVRRIAATCVGFSDSTRQGAPKTSPA